LASTPVDDYGFLITPYRKVKNGKITEEVVWLRADEESKATSLRPTRR
jgi:DNA-directed RNA polymerase subunit beta